ADLVVYHGNLFSVPMIAEKLRLPRVAVLQAPILTPTGAFPCPLYEGEAVGAEENLATYARVFSELTGGIRPLVRAWRTRRLGLPAEEDGALPFLVRDALPSPILYCSSPALYGRPDDWPETSLASGFWLHEDPNEAELDPALLRFLEAGPPPVYVGFGSMRREGARELSLQVASVLERLGLRGVLATGWGGLGRIANRQHLRCIGRVSHRRLFPRVAAVVHHGGASTTGAGLLAARPTWILPFLADQPFWGRRVHALGLGPAPLPQSELDETALAAGLEAVARDPAFRQRAARMGERLRHEEGIEDAVRFVETYAAV
ncbi:MAG: glycosyltransferase, partial [Holophagales bacterium]|nr:glycosyltransferase [Holophagales bacterium]